MFVVEFNTRETARASAKYLTSYAAWQLCLNTAIWEKKAVSA